MIGNPFVVNTIGGQVIIDELLHFFGFALGIKQMYIRTGIQSETKRNVSLVPEIPNFLDDGLPTR